MKRLLALTCFLAACAGGSASIWLKPGTSQQQARQDEVMCLRDASARFPERSRVTTGPRVTIGGRVCEGPACIGINTGRDIFETDTNGPIRDQAFGACMGGKGYRLATLPRCSGSAQILASHPFDTTGLCVTGGQIAAPR